MIWHWPTLVGFDPFELELGQLAKVEHDPATIDGLTLRQAHALGEAVARRREQLGACVSAT